jgi:hypothetical protein
MKEECIESDLCPAVGEEFGTSFRTLILKLELRKILRRLRFVVRCNLSEVVIFIER